LTVWTDYASFFRMPYRAKCGAAMTYSITEEEREGWRKLVLNRPDRLNAFNDEMHDRLSRALDEAATDTQCRAAVLTGAGRGFCAGQDLNDRVASDMEEIDLGQTVERFYNPLIRKLDPSKNLVIFAHF
jgi:2-(1,2-epoxy-1,2-dihydrophenyl)acetyl-CoA isomerase